ncbi:MAG: hypothetical protein ACERLG_08000 [Sedimentibacter sp.]
MKNNKWIKAIICLVAVLVFSYVLKNNVPGNPVEKLISKQDEYLEIKIDYENMSDNFKNKKYYEDSVNKILKEINELNVLMGIKQEQIIEILNENISSCNIESTCINFSEVLPASFNNNNNNDDNDVDQSGEIKNDDEEQTAVMISVEIEFKSSYDNMLKFVDELQSGLIDIVIEHMDIYMDKDNVYGVINLRFYAEPLDVNI